MTKLRMSLAPSEQRLTRIAAPPDVGEARRQAAELARMLAFDPTAAGKLALGITEAGMNIVKHAREGSVLLRPIQGGDQSGIEVLALDRGRGIADIALAMHDGHSTAGSAGTGLGAISRATEAFQIVSHPGKGTGLRFEVWSQRGGVRRQEGFAFGPVCVPKQGESACGDGWGVLERHGRHTLLLVDGLGHGVEAAAAARTALDILARQGEGLSAAALIDALHAGMRATRGAAAAAIVLDLARESGATCGIGNIAVSVGRPGATRKLVSHSGILGHNARRVQEFPFAFPPGALLIAHSDGLDTHWRLEDYPGLERAHPALIAGVLFRDHERRRDDSTVVVARNDTGDRP